ncbi:MAG: fasciclin domain-containing protein [Chitinophagaceae bacterium]|nr:fasciclin domain-containing protein [Chitinophagaceae bacterium]
MKIFNSIKNTGLLLAMGAVFFSACNKLELDPVPNPQPAQGTTPTLATLLDDPNFSILKAAVSKAKLLTTLAAPTVRFTVFAPDDAAFTASGISAGVIGALDSATVTSIVKYHVVPQVVAASSIPGAFPNFQYPTILNPAPSVSALLRLTTFPSVRAGLGAWVNNVPIIATDIQAVNGVIHKVFRVVAPPSTDLWARINTDADLTYLKAAIARADSGVAAGSRLQDALNTAVNPSAIGANLTIFAPTDAAMKTFVTGAIIQALVAQGLPLATAQGQAAFLVATYGTLILTNPGAISPALAAALTPAVAKGVVAYHILGSQSGSFAPPGIRVFSVNLPTTATFVKTLVNSAGGPYALHPGVSVQAVFATLAPSVAVVATATVKGVGNATASNVTTLDLHSINGVMHKIDQVLLPQ